MWSVVYYTECPKNYGGVSGTNIYKNEKHIQETNILFKVYLKELWI
jgi:hypothetical protein